MNIKILKSTDTSLILMEDLKSGLLNRPYSIPAKYFYDAKGSELFEKICSTNEYYPSRAEESLLKVKSSEIIKKIKPKEIFEFGSGTSRKTKIIIEECIKIDCKRYIAFDISESALRLAGTQLLQNYSEFDVNLLIGDYTTDLVKLESSKGDRLWLFLGSTIGNFTHKEGVAFLSDISSKMHDTDSLLIGFDRDKSSAVLNAAYNDKLGYTEQFNLNILNVVGRKYGMNFDPSLFTHRASYNEIDNQMEMDLVSKCDQVIEIKKLNNFFDIKKGEKIRTEISRKFNNKSIEMLVDEAGMYIDSSYQENKYFYSIIIVKKKTS